MARLVGFDGIPPLHETLEDVLTSCIDWLVASGDERVLGAIGFTREADVVDIDRLMVDPDFARRGIGRALLERAISESSAIVSTGRDNVPALELYRSLGFEGIADREVSPGFWIRCLRCPARSSGG
ncbi:MAG: GNAT family N-acetyltransferase [bacterium]|nr:GNAT family N-acetyltransferase [bacterium]